MTQSTKDLTTPFLHPTPAGAYYAVLSADTELGRQLIRHLLNYDATPEVSIATLSEWLATDEDKVKQVLKRMQTLGFVQGLDEPKAIPSGSMQTILPDLLASVSDVRKAILSNAQGLVVSSVGFAHETSEELSALSADLVDLGEKYGGVLHGNLRLHGGAWALVNAAGNSEIGFWPMYFGQQKFTLCISGMPTFNQPQFTDLAWLLARRYGGDMHKGTSTN